MGSNPTLIKQSYPFNISHFTYFKTFPRVGSNPTLIANHLNPALSYKLLLYYINADTYNHSCAVSGT